MTTKNAAVAGSTPALNDPLGRFKLTSLTGWLKILSGQQILLLRQILYFVHGRVHNFKVDKIHEL